MAIEQALKELINLFEKWGLRSDNWCLIGEWALVLQGWGVRERKNILDVYVNRDKLSCLVLSYIKILWLTRFYVRD